MIVRYFFLLLVISSAAFAVEEVSSQPLSRLDRTRLLLFHNADGRIVQGKTKRDWEKRRAEILKAMKEVMGSLPGKEKRCPLDVQLVEEVDCGSYVRRLISYSPEPNSRVQPIC